MKKINLELDDVIEDMKKVFSEQGTLTRRVYDKYGRWSSSKICSIDSFNNLKEMAIGKEEIHRNTIPKEELVEDIFRVAKENEKMTKDVYLSKGKFSRKPIERYFGSWNNMLTELGLKTNCLINIPEDDLINDLLRLITEFDTISANVVRLHGKHSIEVYQRRFGSFNKALEKAGIEPSMRGVSSPTANAMIRMCESILEETAITEKTFSWLKNDLTNKPLYIDAYFESYNIAFEYDGPQHFQPVELYGGEEGFAHRRYLDNLKNELLSIHGVKLFRLGSYEPHTREYVIKKLSSIL